jgi:GntR family carbon starvation induced transcriptional regulator
LASMSVEETQARVAAERLMADIRSGVLRPGSRLGVSELRERYGIGASPLREALLLVTSLGYATGESHRGYRVAEISFDDLADITLAREVIETGMLRESMQRRSDEWAVGIVAALERLRLAVARSPLAEMNETTATGAAHKHFHVALVSGCHSPRLLKAQTLLYDQAARYREIMVGQVKSAELFIEVHDQLARIVLSGDFDAASEALRGHLNLTPRDVYAAIAPDRTGGADLQVAQDVGQGPQSAAVPASFGSDLAGC